MYLWDIDGGFAGCFLIKKKVSGDRYVNKGSWDSINVVEVHEESSTKATYKLTSTVILHMEVDKEEVGKTSLAGSLTRQTELSSAVNEVKTHMANIGRMIEDQENDMRYWCSSHNLILLSQSLPVCPLRFSRTKEQSE